MRHDGAVATLEDDERMLSEHAAALADAVDEAIGPWVIASVARRATGFGAEASRAAEQCRAELAPRIRALLSTDLDEQRTTPLVLLREAASYATRVLADAGIAPVARDDFARRVEPDDVYDLSAATWSDFGERVGEAGLVWGAAKAHVHLRRRNLR